MCNPSAVQRQMFDRKLLAVLIVAIAAGLGLFAALKFFGHDAARRPALQATLLYPQPRNVPDFSLQQSDGTQLTSGELHGHWTLLYIGYTFCPDVCPTTLQDLAQAQKQWTALPDSTRPRLLFVSVDPQRDTPARLGEYVHAFDPDTLAATADAATLENFAREFGLVYMKVEGPHFAENPNDYSMDHSANLVLLDPQGRIAGTLRPPFEPAKIAADLTLLSKESQP